MSQTTMVLSDIADVAVTSAGTRQALATTTLVRNVTIQWHPSNAGNVYLGGSAVAAGRGLILNAANPVANISVDDSFADDKNIVIDLAAIYIDAANTGDKVKLAYVALSSVSY